MLTDSKMFKQVKTNSFPHTTTRGNDAEFYWTCELVFTVKTRRYTHLVNWRKNISTSQLVIKDTADVNKERSWTVRK